ncbi:hypothetical protein JM93_00930 [Roseibium hamelinense]|uniref:Uncharacterized protein n=1 Tax=Roseibium hamelinense TaxID=150831 RepID=A0A562TJ30_9HYPH|nr:hypothetical protein [Roseibium hamelinense]MTI42628.1 hypothetical protein [Roseibium hamelinense]TWI93374.1 hypothetical protein JM93_00930 [Roseibium hamelinense]
MDFQDELGAIPTQQYTNSGQPNQVLDGSGLNYQTQHTYFYVPKSANATDNATDDQQLGTFLRLGEYSDVEEQTKFSMAYTDIYPQHHIDEAKAAGTDPYATAAGEPADSHGILLACDGRILVKAGEKLFTQVKGDYDLDVEDNITIRAENGGMNLVTGDRLDRAKLESELKDSLGKDFKLGAKDIVISADDGNASYVERSRSHDVVIKGKSETRVTGDTITTYKANTESRTYGDSLTRVDGISTGIVWGHKRLYTMGGKLELNLAASLAISLSADFAIKTFSLQSDIMSIGYKLSGISITKFDFEKKDLSAEVSGVEVSSTASSSSLSFVEVWSSSVTSASSVISQETDSLCVSSSSVSSSAYSVSALSGSLTLVV